MTIHPHNPAPMLAAFTVERAAFHAAAAFLAGSIVERRNTIPILSNVLIVACGDTVTLRGTDLDIQATFTVPAHVDSPGAFTVAAAALADVVKAATKEAMITLRHDGNGRVAIIHGRARNMLPTLPTGDFPALAINPGGGFTVDGAAFDRDLARLAPFIGTDEARYYIGGVAFQPADNGASLAMTATTGALLARIVRPMPAGGDTLPESCIVPRKAVKALRKLLKKTEAEISVAADDKGASFALPGVRLVAKLIDGTFPNIPAFLERIEEAGRQRLAFYDLEPDLAPAHVEAFRKALGTVPDVDASDPGYVFTVPGSPEFIGVAARDTRENAGRFSYETPGWDAARDYLADLARSRGLDVDAHLGEPNNAGERHLSHMLRVERGLVIGCTFGAVRSPGDDDVQTATFKGPFYTDGAFSVVMPRERAGMAAACTIEGPDGLEYAVRVGTTGIELSAAAVRRIAGEIDPATLIDIPASTFHHGKALKAGWMLPKAPKLDKARVLYMTAAEMRAYADACRPVYVGVPDVAEMPASEPVEPVAIVEALPEPEAAPIAPAAAVEPVGADLEPVAVDGAAETIAALAERVAALEAMIARIAQPAALTIAAPANDNAVKRVRSEGERRAILRAWRMRGELRAARADAADYEARFMRACRERGAIGRQRDDALVTASRAQRRAGRLVSIAAGHRKAARRAAEDVRGARAETRALMRRLEAATAAPPARQPAPVMAEAI